jgi:acyl phosphate:glycerol-3-phosphate acyltransferase
MPVAIFIALFGYLLGSIPTGLVLARLFSKKDPRTEGSGNIGATNLYRTAGKTIGLLTLAGDILKGTIPVGIAMRWGLPDQWGIPADAWIAFAGLSPFLGHVFPIFLGFKGGKGVATALGIYLPISPIAVLLEGLVFFGMVWKWRFVSLGSITCASTIPILIAFFRSDSQAYFILSVIIAALIVYRHQANIARLLQGTENKWNA